MLDRERNRGGVGRDAAGRHQARDNESGTSRGRHDSAATGDQRGFASMEPEQQREIARRGGEASHGGHGARPERGQDEGGRDDDGPDRRAEATSGSDERSARSSGSDGAEEGNDGNGSVRARQRRRDDADDSGESQQGFASMDPEERRELARPGGETSHGGRPDRGKDDESRRGRSSSGGREARGFAAMDPEELHKIASRGGKAASRKLDRDERGRFESTDGDGSKASRNDSGRN